VGSSADGQVCYIHGSPPDKLPSPTNTNYEDPAKNYAESVQIMLDAGQEVAQFDALVATYFEDTFVANEDGTMMMRGDPSDVGPPYRNVIGIPGGMGGLLFPRIEQANLHCMELREGSGVRDLVDEGIVYIYDSIKFPFYRGEQYHMFHPNLVLERDLPAYYMTDAKQLVQERGWIEPTCSEQEDGSFTTNIEVVAAKCSAGFDGASAPATHTPNCPGGAGGGGGGATTTTTTTTSTSTTTTTISTTNTTTTTTHLSSTTTETADANDDSANWRDATEPVRGGKVATALLVLCMLGLVVGAGFWLRGNTAGTGNLEFEFDQGEDDDALELSEA
jgi:hypothetical protein